MGWKAFSLALRLLSPVHIGAGAEGNLQRTRPYVTGKALWGALTARLARDCPDLRGDYAEAGRRVHAELALSYLYPTGGEEKPLWPWGQTADAFRWRFLGSVASTAIDPSAGGAHEGSLHEIEHISPVTRDAQPVILRGYIFCAEGSQLPWPEVLPRLQLGGERGYGWGRVEVERLEEVGSERVLFGMYDADPGSWPPVVTARGRGDGEAWLLAHALAVDVEDPGGPRRACSGLSGPVEPLVGRETGAAGAFGARLSPVRVAWVPGTPVSGGTRFRIGPYGLWEGV
ncbi:MAG: CRISPR-associated protein [Anaerolineae bacterium]|nr:CRISPR-associated protein [Anaerolineae bacterium]